jgi:hypothetical protein
MKLTKKDLVNLQKHHLIHGRVLPIYCNWRDNTGLLGYARLNYQVESEDIPFERATVGEGKLQEPAMIIYKYQRWNITYVDPLEFDPNMDQPTRWRYLSQKGFTTNWNISYFVTIDSNYLS